MYVFAYGRYDENHNYLLPQSVFITTLLVTLLLKYYNSNIIKKQDHEKNTFYTFSCHGANEYQFYNY